MARGVTPRRPGKTGRHEAAGGARTSGAAVKNRSSVVPHPLKGAKGGAASIQGRNARKKSSVDTYNPLAPERVSEILRRLDLQYPGVTCALTHKDAWELVVATILSAQSTDVRVNMVTPELFKKYPTVQDFARLEAEQLETDIRSTGFFRNKSKSVVGAAKRVVNEFGGRVPDNMDDLLTLPGVARKTANVVSAERGHAQGIVVDTHVRRLSQRLGLTKQEDPVKIERDLVRLVPRADWDPFPHLLIWHGRRICDARRPLCEACVINDLCPSSRV
jgi:endonuclease III